MSRLRTVAGIVLVRAGPDDEGTIRSLDGMGDSTRRLLAVDLARDDRRFLLARDAHGTPVGVTVVTVGAGEAHLLDLAVDPGHRRRGIGSALVAAARDLAREQLGAHAMTLEVRRSNHAARALYRRLGFVEAGERPDYYPDGGPGGGREAAVVMWDDWSA